MYRAQQVDQSDQYDELLELVIALWSPDGPLARKRLAEHSYEGITEDQSFDPQKLYDSGIYLSVISLTYQDVIDD